MSDNEAEAAADETVAKCEAALRQNGADENARTILTNHVMRHHPRYQSRYRPVMVATVGGAGTYFTIHFFEFLERRSGSYSKDYDPIPQGGFKTFVAFPNLGLLKLTNHALCPGFEASYAGSHRADWERMAEEGKVDRVPSHIQDWFDPRLNPESRLLHIYRDPFDHAVTGYRSALRQGRVPQDTRENFEAFVRGFDVKQYVAQHFTYRVMAEEFPAQVRLLRFEELVAQPERVFRGILDFFGVGTISSDLIRSSVRSSSPERLIAAEDRSGRASGPAGAVSHFDRDRAARSRITWSEADRAAVIDSFAALGIAISDVVAAA